MRTKRPVELAELFLLPLKKEISGACGQQIDKEQNQILKCQSRTK